jgi:hypothetical protein
MVCCIIWGMSMYLEAVDLALVNDSKISCGMNFQICSEGEKVCLV